MRTRKSGLLLTMTLSSLFLLGTAQADDKAAAQSLEQHHPDAKVATENGAPAVLRVGLRIGL